MNGAATAHYVLVIDADDQVCEAVRAKVDEEIIYVHCAHDLEEAEALLKNILHSLVIVDVALMPSEARQREFVRLVRKLSSQTRILFLVPPASRTRRTELSLAIDGLLPKSAQPALMADLVGELLRQP